MPLKDANKRIDCDENKQENKEEKQFKTQNKNPAVIFLFRSRHYLDILTQYEVILFILMSGLTTSGPGCGVRWLRRLIVLPSGDSLLAGN